MPLSFYANNLFFKSAYNVQVAVDDNEPDKRLLDRFGREVVKAGVNQESKRRKFFSRRHPQFKSLTHNKQDIPTTKKEEDDDKWDLPTWRRYSILTT